MKTKEVDGNGGDVIMILSHFSLEVDGPGFVFGTQLKDNKKFKFELNLKGVKTNHHAQKES